LSNRPTKSVISQLIKSKNNTKDLLCQEALGYSFVTRDRDIKDKRNKYNEDIKERERERERERENYVMW
jgi:hypothetical protein